MENLQALIKEHNWSLISKKWNPQLIVEKLSYEECMYLAYHMLVNKQADDDLINFAVDLLQAIRKKYLQNWESDWRNDLFLGDACHIAMRFDERYEAYKRASLKFNPLNLPPTLLVSLARCYSAPGVPPISIAEAEKLARAAVEKEISTETVALIRGICKTQGRDKEYFYWNKVLEELEKKGPYIRNEWPEWLMANS